MSFDTLKQQYDDHILPTYARYPVAFVKGTGSRLYDADGKAYIDFAAGIGVSSIGHAHPDWVAAVAEQAAKLTHTSNLYYTAPGGKLAEKLCALTGMRGVFFANSGAEANEGLIKTARKYSRDTYGEGRATIVALEGSFHGRTVTTLSATGQAHFHQHFHPFTPGFVHVPPNDLAALQAQGKDVCALLLEPIQGEGGVVPLDADYVRQAADLCAERNWLLLMDEVQTGVGRTGDWFGFQGYDTPPDAFSFAKGIAGGLPMGGFMVNEKLARTLGAGDHGSTFGGNPLCAAAALATLEILAPVVPTVAEKGAYLRAQIEAMGLPAVRGVRGRGLMLGVQLSGASHREINAQLLQAGLVCLTAGADVLRLLPPLTITREEMDEGLAVFKRVLERTGA